MDKGVKGKYMIRIYKKAKSEKLSANFKTGEFHCQGVNCCTQTPIDDKLVEFLQKIRDHFGKPVLINSGYRCKKHNAQIPNAGTRSKHMDGMAADIMIRGIAPKEIARFAESIGVKGIGCYDTAADGYFVHIDTRESKYFWRGHAQVYTATFGGETEMQKFVKAVQSAIGAGVDGIPGRETLGKTPTVSACKNARHPVVKVLQSRLYDLGYKQVGKIDGIAGKKFEAAVIAFQKDHGCVPDGELTAGKTTWKKILGM